MTASTDEQTSVFAELARRVRGGEPAGAVTEELLALLTREEVLGLLDGDEPFWAAPNGYNRTPYVLASVERLGVPGLRFSDGPRGVVMGHSTAFPVSMARGASWDAGLERRVGEVIGREVRAQGGNFFAGVCINLLRHPAWGRAQETYGEDPVHLGAMGAALTRGVRRHVMACVKHFALNSMENARFTVDVSAGERALHEMYLPHFRTVIEAGADGVMSAYNSVNGEWCGQNHALLTEILRDEWGFQGVVISDFLFGIRDAVASVRAGLDVEAPYAQLRAHDLPIALDEGRLAWAEVEATARRVLRTQLRWAAQAPDEDVPLDVVASAEHAALAREVAGRSMVLLRNAEVEGSPALPLAADRIGTLAVLGHLADLPNTGDNGSSNVPSPYVVTPLQGLRAALPNASVVHATGLAQSVAAARDADAAVVVVGYTADDEGEFLQKDTLTRPDLRVCFPPIEDESARDLMTQKGRALAGEQSEFTPFGGSTGGDRASLRLKPEDEELIAAVSAVNPRTVVVLVAGSAVVMETWKEKPAAILYAWYAGMEGGNALADVVLGRRSPSGRLPFAIPVREEDLPFFDRDASAITYDLWHGQRLLDRDETRPAFPLGFGLGYTSFTIGAARVTRVDTENGRAEAQAEVTNVGSRAGHHVVQWYARQPDGDEEARVRTLVGFDAVRLEPGQTATVRTSLTLRPLRRRSEAGRTWLAPRGLVRFEASAFSGDPDASTTEAEL